MTSASRLELTLLPGAPTLLMLHRQELPQRDDLCGAFCGALALRAAGVERYGGDFVDQDAVAVAAGSMISEPSDGDSLPSGEHGRRDYRLSLPLSEDASVSGTTAAGLVRAVGEVSRGALVAIPFSGPWSTHTLAGLFETVGRLERPVALVANLATRQLWGSRPDAGRLLEYLLEGTLDGPDPDWDVGHFVCVVARVRGPAGSLYVIADTYPSLGSGGVHAQPAERLARALERPEMPAGGMIAIASAGDVDAVRTGAGALGMAEGSWDNGSVMHEMLT